MVVGGSGKIAPLSEGQTKDECLRGWLRACSPALVPDTAQMTNLQLVATGVATLWTDLVESAEANAGNEEELAAHAYVACPFGLAPIT